MDTDQPTLSTRGPTAGTPRRVQADPHQHIPRAQVLEIRNAYLFAEVRQTSLNTWITLNFVGSRHWRAGDRSPGQIKTAKQKFLKAISDWCDRQGFEPIYIYALENPPQGGHGPHMHILQHLPSERWSDLRGALYQCLITAGSWPEERFAPDYPWKPLEIFAEELVQRFDGEDRLDRLNRLRYMVKGIDPQEAIVVDGKRITLAQLSARTAAAKDFRPGIKLEAQGDVRITKRAGASHVIGKAARKASGWADDNDLSWLSGEHERRQKLAAVRAMLVAAHAVRDPANTMPVQPI